MFPIGESYKKYFGDLNGYHITCVIPKPMRPDFLYGRSLVSSSKVLQSLDNETFRNIIRKFRQAIEPPMGTKSGKIFSKDIFNPGSITQGIMSDDLSTLITHQGVNSSEFAVLNLIQQKTADFIGASSSLSKQGKVTAREIIEAQKEAVKMMGMSVISYMRLKKNLTYLRLMNVLENYKKPIKKTLNNNKIDNKYQRFTVSNGSIGDKTGKKIIQFMDRDLTRPEQEEIYRFERQETEKNGTTGFFTINIKKLQDIKAIWYVNIIQKEKDSSELSKAMFTEKLNNIQAVSQMTGRPINPDKLTEEAERLWKSKDLFQKEAPIEQIPQEQLNLNQPQGQPLPQQGQMASQIEQATLGKMRPQAPSLNTMI